MIYTGTVFYRSFFY